MIQNFSLSKLSHEDLLAYTTKVSDLLSSSTLNKLNLQAAKFQEAIDEFASAVQNTPELLALEIQAKDTAVDEAWRGLNTELENNLDHPNAEKREASSKVYDIWSIHEDPTELPFDEEYRTLESIITDLSDVSIDLLKKAAVDEWFDALKARYKSFIAMWGEDSKDDAQRLARQLKVTRNNLESVYDDLIFWINSWFIYDEDSWYSDFERNMNDEINRLKSALSAAAALDSTIAKA